jgi:hypothetical protein
MEMLAVFKGVFRGSTRAHFHGNIKQRSKMMDAKTLAGVGGTLALWFPAHPPGLTS